MRVLITGATGFIGREVVARLAADGNFIPRAASRQQKQDWQFEVEAVRVGELGADTDWREAANATEVVVHAAARVHMMKDNARDPQAELRRVNLEGSLNLARQAAKAGVQRFVFISSIKVNGEGTFMGRPFAADDVPAPVDLYGISKHKTEEGLRHLAKESGMELVCIRPSLVYGPRVKGNFLSMIHWLGCGVPLPLGAIRNRRSLVGLDNLVDLIVTCLDHPAAANQTFLVSDDEDLSTAELLRRMGAALGKPARLAPVPPTLLGWGARLLGKGDIVQRLLGNLQVDITKTKNLLDWNPPFSVDEGLRKTAEWYLTQR